MPKYIVSLLQKTSNDTFMTDKKPELSAAMKSKLEPKKFTKNPILGTKFTIAISSACLLYTSPSPRDAHESRMPSSA